MRRAFALVALLGALTACQDDPQEIGPQDVVRLLISHDSLNLRIGDTIVLGGMALDASGAVRVGAELSWGVDRPDILQVDAVAGTAIGRMAGVATVSARFQNLAAEARVFVAPGPILVLSDDSSAFSVKAGGANPAEDTLRITNGGGFSVTGLTVDSIGYADTAVTGWLMAAIDSGSAPTNLRLTPMTTGLTVPGMYGAFVTVSSTSADSSPQVVRVSLQVTPGDPATLAANAGDSQTAVVGQTVPTAPSVRVRDAFGNPVPGVAVAFDVTAGGGSAPVPPVAGGRINGGLRVDTTVTNAAGVATVTSWRLGPTVGLNVLEATIVGDTVIAPVTFTATGTPGGASQITATQGAGGQVVTVGTAVPILPGVRVQDQFGNNVPGAAITFTARSGNGTLSGATPTTDAEGLATLGGWTLDTLIGADTVTAQVAGVADTVRFIVIGQADAATDIASLQGDGQADTVGATLPVSPTVAVSDQYGNPVAGILVGFAVTSGGGGLGATSVATGSNGQAAATWTLGSAPGAQTVTATASGLAGSPVTFTATASPGAPSLIVAIQGDGQSATAGTTVTTAPTVRVSDALGNPVADVVVTFSVTAGGGSLTGGTDTTNVAGLASVGSWTLGPAVGANTLHADGGGALTVDFTATGTAAGADTIYAIAGTGQNATVGTAVATRPAVRVTDQFGNPVSGVSVTFVVTGGGGSVSGPTVATDASGDARPTSWTLGTAAGANTVQALSGGLNGSPVIFSATGIAGAADSIAIVAGNGQLAGVGTTVATAPVVRLFDQYGNPVPGVEVVFAVTAGAGNVTPAADTTDATGTASVATWTLGTATGANTLTATATGAGITNNPRTFTATGTAGAAATITVAAGDAQTATVGTAVATAPSVTVTDQYGNPVATGTSVVFAVTGGGGGVVGGTTTTNGAGTATVGSWTLGTVVGPNALQVTAGGATPANFSATGVHSVASVIVVTTQPSGSGVSGVPLAQQPAVALVDQYGNAVDTAGVALTASLIGASSLDGTLGRFTGAAGTALWTDLAVTGIAGSTYYIAFSGAGLTPDTSAAIVLSVGAASTIALSAGNAQTDTVGQTLPVAPAVLVTDGGGNPVAGVQVVFAVTGGGGTIAGDTALTSATGIAVLGSWTLGTTPGANTLSATSGGLTGSPLAFTATAVADAPNTVAVNQGDLQTATAGTAVATAPSVTVTDQYGNPVVGAVVVFAVASGAGSVTGGTDTTDAAGAAAVGSWTLGTAAGGNSLTATVGALTPATFTATADHDVAAALSVTMEPSANAVNATPFAQQPAVALVDQYGNAVDSAGVAVTASLVGVGTLDGTVLEATGLAGTAAWLDLGITATPGLFRVAFTGAGLVPDTSAAIALLAGPPDTIFARAGDGQSATVGTAVATNPVVRVTDAFANAAAGVEVVFAVTGGGGSLAATVDTTDANGDASPGTWTLGTGVGANTVTATSGVLNGSPVTFTATGTVGAANTLAISTGDGQTATVATAVATAPRVLVTDQFGNPVGGIGVTFAVTGGGGIGTGLATTSDASGFASVGSWTLGTVAGANTMSATSAGLGGSPLTFTATGDHDVAVRLNVMTEPPASALSGALLVPQPTVQVLDQYGNPADSAGIVVTAALIEVGTLGGTTAPATGVSGLATWTNLAITGAVGTYRIRFTASGMTPDTSVTITLSAGAATAVAVSAGAGQTDTVGQTLPVNPRVRVRDGANNPVTGVEVTFAITAGGGSLTGGTVLTDVSGLATVGSWTLGTTPGTNTMTATATGLAGSPVTFTATAVVDSPDTVYAVAGEAQGALAGSAVDTAPGVRVDDQYGNPIAGRNVTFAVTAGGGSVNPVTAVVTNAGGESHAFSWTLGLTPGVNTLTATVTGTGIGGNPLTFTANGLVGGDGSLQVAQQPSATATAGAMFVQQPTVQLYDTLSVIEAVAGVNVTASLASGAGGTLQGTLTVATGGTGLATFTDLRVDGAVGKYVLAFSAPARTGAQTDTVVVSAAAADTIFVSAGDAQNAAVNTAVATPPAVTVTDQFGNPVAGENVTFAVTSGSGVVDPVTAIATDAAGVAQVTSWTLGTAAVANALSATSAGLNGSPVAITATATADVPDNIAVNAGDNQSATVNAAVTIAPRVLVTDQFGNPVAGAEVVFAVSGGGGSVTGATDTTEGSGFATVGSWTLGTTVGANSLTGTASAGGVTGNPVTFNATASAGSAAVLVITTEPAVAGQAGVALVPQPVVQLRDAFGNDVAQNAVSITATLVGSGTLGGTTSQNTLGSGAATFTNLSIGALAGSYRLRVASGGLVPDTSISITLTAGVADTVLRVSGNGQTDTASAMLTPPVVEVRDAFGNPVSGIEVVFAVTGGGGGVTGATVNTDGTGRASPATWQLGTGTGANTLTATSAGLKGSPVLFTATATAGNATTIALNQGDAQTATVGTAVSTLPRVLVTDQNGNPVAGITVNFAASGTGAVGAGADVTDASGFADPTSWTLGTTPGVNSDLLTATSAGLAGSPVTFTASATVGAAATIAVVSGTGQTDTVRATVTAPVVRVTDQYGNPVMGTGVTFTANGDGQVTGGATTTDVNGDASPTTWVLGTTAGNNSDTLFATSGTLAGSPVAIAATATVGTPDIIFVVSGTGQSDTVRSALTPPVVRVTDLFGNPVSGVGVTFTASGTGQVTGATPTTGANGNASPATWVLGTRAATDSDTLFATSGTLGGSPVEIVATATAGNATTIVLNGGDGQSAAVNTAVATDPRVLVTDQFGNPRSGVPVTFAVFSGGGSVDPVSAIATDGNGLATVTSWTLGTGAGANTLRATSSGLTGSPVTFSATGTAGTAMTIAIASGDGQTAPVGTSVTPPVVLVTDQHGNPVQGVGVTFSPSGTGQVTGGSATTDGAGLASPTSWTLATAVGSNTLTATSAGLAGSPLEIGATGTVGPPTTLSLATINGQTATVGQTTDIPPRVSVSDFYGNPVSGVSVTFAVTGGGGSVDPVTPVLTGQLGIGIANSWTLGTTAGLNTLTATSTPALDGSPVEFTATGEADVATSIVVSAGNGQSATVNTAVAIAPRVLVRDQYNNPVSGVPVTFAVFSGGGSVNPVSAIMTDGNGLATVTSWTLGTGVGANSLRATSSGLTGSPVTFTATATVGAPSIATSTISSNVGAFTAQAGNTAATITVTVRDQFTNVISGATVTLGVDGSDNAIAQPGSTTNGSGVTTGTFGSTRAELKTVSATIVGTGTLTNTVNVTVNAGAATAANSEVTTNLSSITANNNGSSQATITVTARDQFNNPVGSQSVTLAALPVTGNTVTQPVGTTNSLGQITGAFYSTKAEDKTITATLNGVLGVTDNAVVTVNAAAPNAANSSVNQGTSPITAGGAGSLITVTALDQFANPVANAVVTLQSNQTGGSFTAIGNTNGSGVTTSTFTSTNAASGVPHTISGTAGGVAITDQASVTVNPAVADAGQTLITVDDALIQAADLAASVTTEFRSLVTVTVRDIYGNNRAGDLVTFTPNDADDFWKTTTTGTTLGNSVTTDVNGVAQRVFFSTTAAGKTLFATGTSISESIGVTVSPAAANAGQTLITVDDALIQAADLAASVTTEFRSLVTVTVRDMYGNNRAGDLVTFTPSDANDFWKTTTTGMVLGNSVTTNSSGVAQRVFFSTFAAAKTLIATGTNISESIGVTVSAAATFSVTLNSTNNQTARVGVAVATDPSFLVRDVYLNPKVGVTVSYAVTSGGGSVTGSTQTNPSGIATVASWTLGGTSGVITTAGTFEGHMINTMTGTNSAIAATATAYSRYEWTEDVYPIVGLPSSCNTSCHAVFPFTRANLINVASTTQTACDGFTRVIPGNSASSVLYSKVTASPFCGVRMPQSCTTNCFTTTQLKIIQSWIEDGAPDN